jgi:hypothetical protein
MRIISSPISAVVEELIVWSSKNLLVAKETSVVQHRRPMSGYVHTQFIDKANNRYGKKN